MTATAGTTDQIDHNLVHICRDQIIGAARSGDEERLDYWLGRYAELVGKRA